MLAGRQGSVRDLPMAIRTSRLGAGTPVLADAVCEPGCITWDRRKEKVDSALYSAI